MTFEAYCDEAHLDEATFANRCARQRLTGNPVFGRRCTTGGELARDGRPERTKAADSLRGFSGRDLDRFKADRQ
jgi:hypothetical protein